jgi:hypothetical protein
MEGILLKKEEAEAKEFLRHIQRLTGKQFLALVADFYSGKTFFKKDENATILEYIRYCTYNYAVTATHSAIATALSAYPNIKRAVLAESEKHVFRAEHPNYLNMLNIFEGIRILDSYSNMLLPFDKSRLITTVLYYDDKVFGYSYMTYDEYNVIIPSSVMLCFGEEYASHDGSFRSAVMCESNFELVFVFEDTKDLVKGIAEALSDCDKHISRKVYGYDSIDNLRDDIKETFAIHRKCYYAHWIISHFNHATGGTSNTSSHEYDEATYASLLSKFGEKKIMNFVGRLQRMSHIYASVEIWFIHGLSNYPQWARRRYGQKIIGLYGQERDMVGSFACRQWLEVYISEMVNEFHLNNICFNFSVVHDWTIIKNVDDMVASNTFYKDSKYKHNEAIMMLCRNAASFTFSGISKLCANPVLSKMYNITELWQMLPAFSHFMFGTVYGVLCLNEKLAVIHGDLHSDNVLVGIVPSLPARHTCLYLVDGGVGGGSVGGGGDAANPETLYIFNEAYYTPVVVDFGRSFIYDMPNTDRMLIYYKTMFPEFYKENRETLENNMETNRSASYKAFSAIDIYILCESVISNGLASDDRMALVLQMKKIAETYLFRHMLDMTATEFCAREIISLFGDYAVDATAKIDASTVSSYSILSQKMEYSIKGKLPPMCTPNLIRHNGENLELTIGTGFSYAKRHKMRVKRGADIYDELLASKGLPAKSKELASIGNGIGASAKGLTPSKDAKSKSAKGDIM